MTNDDKNLILTQVQTDVSPISFLSVISVFFIGALLPKFDAYDLSVKIPISFLIVSTFAFLFFALILSNASQKIITGNTEQMKKYTSSVITNDLYLRIVTFLSAIVGIGFYQFLGFSFLDQHFTKSSKIFSLLILLFGTGLFISQILAFHFTLVSVAFLVFIFVITCLGPVENFQ